MTDPIHSLGRQLSANLDALAEISQNVAHASTPGYRAGRVVPTFADEVARTAIDLSAGPRQLTGRPLDLAIDGPGWFVVEGPDGVRSLVRSASFRVDADGVVRDVAGQMLLGESGPLQWGTGAVSWRGGQFVDAEGGFLPPPMIVDTAAAALDRSTGGGIRAPETLVASTASRVVPGSLEGSNVDPVGETLALLQLTRHTETLQRAVAIYDRLLDSGINRLGEH
jgi:flagellar basal-body rod protein FlgG